MDKDKELFEKSTEKQLKLEKKIILYVLGSLGLIFIILGIILWQTVDALFLIFTGLGAFFLALSILLYFVLPNKLDYEKCKKRINKYGIMSYYELIAKVEILESKVEELEKKINE